MKDSVVRFTDLENNSIADSHHESVGYFQLPASRAIRLPRAACRLLYGPQSTLLVVTTGLKRC
jgi:hypothetical protein